jgi:hypothetical protein
MPTTPPDDLPPTRRRRTPRRPRPGPAPRDGADRLPTVERTTVLEAGDDVSPALDRLRGVHAATLAPVVGVHRVGSGFALTHAVPGDAVTLADLRAATPLRSGHVVTVITAAAEALVVLHAAGLAHGSVDAEHLLVAPDGSVVLAGTGLAWSRPPGDPEGPAPEDDVAAAAELIRHLLGAGTASAGLVLVGLRAADPDPALRLDADSLAEAVRRCGPAVPLLDLLWLTDQPLRQTRSTDNEGGSPAPSLDAGDVPHAQPPPTSAPVATRWLAELDGPIRQGAKGDRAPSGPAPRRRALRPQARRRRPYAAVAVLATVVSVGGALAVRASGGVASASEGAGAASTTSPILGLGAASSAVSSTGRTGAPSGSMPDPLSDPGPGSLTDPAVTAHPAASPDVTSAGSAVIDVDRGAAPAPAWSTVLRDIDAGRLHAIASGSVDDLAGFVDRAGPAFAADSELAARVAASGAALRGGELQVLAARTVDSTSSRIVLQVRDRRAAYAVEIDGATAPVAARAPRWWQVTLARGRDGRWRIFDVTPSGAAGGSG